ncbi:MAG: hypothetical protein ACTSWQ_10995 [Candidatus Thorarchaeota archaeon]
MDGNKMAPPTTRKCQMRDKRGRVCGEPQHLVFEGSGKYDIYYCKTHGSLSVRKERVK